MRQSIHTRQMQGWLLWPHCCTHDRRPGFPKARPDTCIAASSAQWPCRCRDSPRHAPVRRRALQAATSGVR
jgi:hypothetical protein